MKYFRNPQAVSRWLAQTLATILISAGFLYVSYEVNLVQELQKSGLTILVLAMPVLFCTAVPVALRKHLQLFYMNTVKLAPSRAGHTCFEYVFLKRVQDILLTALLLLVTAPVMTAVALLVWAKLGRPILIRQRRVGRGGQIFWLHKFRTLPVSELDRGDHCWCVNAPGSWARLLRSAGLDELPQLWNVLRGEMSLVGPRPERPYFVEQFARQWPAYSERHQGMAGITGWAQIHGLRGNTSISDRLEHDMYYLRNWSLQLDFYILRLTVCVVLRELLKLRNMRNSHA